MRVDSKQSEAGRWDDSTAPTVVIVDGESLYRWFVAESLGRNGMKVLQFKNLADAGAYLDRRALSGLMLVDAQTLADEGIESLAARRRFSTLQWVVLEPAGTRATSSSVEGVASTPKPVDPDALRSLVHAHLHDAA